MNINELTLGQAKELVGLFSKNATHESHPWEIGGNYFIRTVTMAQTGRLIAVYAQEIVLEDAAWIADTGRFAQAVATGNFSEIEPFPDNHKVIVGRSSIVDALKIPTLPRSQK